MEPLCPQPPHAFECVSTFEQLENLVEEAGSRHVLQQLGERPDRLEGRRIHIDAKLRREAHRSQHPDRILAVARGRIADHAQLAGAQVLHAAEVIDDFFGNGIVVQRVDREIAAQCVFLFGAENVVVEHAAVLVGLSVDLHGAKRRDLDGLAAEDHVDDAEAPADEARATEEPLHGFRRRVGSDVEILRAQAQQQVAHAAAHHIRLEACLLQSFAGLERGARDGGIGQLRGRPPARPCARRSRARHQAGGRRVRSLS